jgi:preprotein translocase SecE subunit
MAETPDGKKTKRRVRDPETFRERAIKAAETSNNPTRQRRLRTASHKATSPFFRSVSRTFGTIFNRQPFKWLGKIIFPSYLRNSWKELRLVTWPTLYESRRLTFAVLVFAIIFGAVIAGVDYGLDKIFRNILLK